MLYKLGNTQPQLKGEGHFIASNATVVGDVILEASSSVWFSAVIRGDKDQITLGENSNIQDGAVLHTDPGVPLVIGRGVTVGHNAMLHGCTVGDNSLIGINAVVLNRVRIGKNCIVGASAMVAEGTEIPDNSLVVGCPAKVIRQTNEETWDFLKKSALSYVENAQRYNHELEEVS